MKICWDNLEGLRYNKKTGKWYKKCKGKHRKKDIPFIYKERCKYCGNPFLSANKNGKFCCKSCSLKGKGNPNYGKKRTKETRKKISKALKGMFSGDKNPSKRPEVREKIRLSKLGLKHTQKTKDKISKTRKGKALNNKNNWQGGYNLKNIPTYDTYAPQIDWCEEVRRNKKDYKVIEVKCTWCGKWFIPSLNSIHHRIQYLKGNYSSEHRFYCSDGCKNNCPVYNKSPESLMKEDALKAGRLSWLELNREVQPELRQMVFKRDNWECQRCNETEGLHCHHILPVSTNPIESADIDNCLALCKDCHKEIHQIPGCRYGELRVKIC